MKKYFYNLSVTIVGIVTSVFILTTVGGLFHIPVNPFFVFIPFIGGIYFLKKQSPENIDFLKQLLILLLIIIVSYIISLTVWDSSWDGRSYHSALIIMLKNGWLPVYQDYQDFAKLCHIYPSSAFWGNCYLKFDEIVGANIYKLTNLLESAKTINFIMLSAVFMYSFSVLKEFKQNNKFIPIIASVIIILNPVCICQWFTNFIDLHLYFAFTLLVLTIIKTEFQQEATKTDLFMFVSSSLMLAMTKFTGCMYLFIICLLYFIYLILSKRNIKKYIKTVLVIGGLIALTSVNPFYTNFRDYGHPFYPVFGENKINVIQETIPCGFENMPGIKVFLLNNFFESVNATNLAESKRLGIPVTLKLPFTLHLQSFSNYFYCPDMRVGGFGYFWSGILLLSLFYLPFIRFRNKDEKHIFYLLTLIVLVSVFTNPHCWWARLVPQFWLFPFFIMFFGFLQENYGSKNKKILKLVWLYFILLSFIVNSLVILLQNTPFSIKLTKLLKAPYEYIDLNKKPQDKILLMVKPETSEAGKKHTQYDETVISHLEEYYGKENIIYVPFDENKIYSKDYLPIQYTFVVEKPCYFFKIENRP